MTVEEFRTEAGKVLATLTKSGFATIDPGTIENCKKLAGDAEGLGMKSGHQLMENLANVMAAIKDGKSGADSGNIRLTALDFYLKKLEGGNTEDL